MSDQESMYWRQVDRDLMNALKMVDPQPVEMIGTSLGHDLAFSLKTGIDVMRLRIREHLKALEGEPGE